MNENLNQTYATNPSNTISTPWNDDQRLRHTSGTLILGGILVLAGAVLIMQNFGLLVMHNWWALFILIPALGSFATAYDRYQAGGRRFTAAVRGAMVGGLFFSLISATFLFGINFAVVWPLFLVLAGLSMLLNFALSEG